MKACKHCERNIILRNRITLIVAALMLQLACSSPVKGAAQQEPVFRAPFAVKLHIDDEHYYEQNFQRVPYVAENEVYLFAGETFGISVTITNNWPAQITYQRDAAKSDVEFRFTQEKSPDGFMMVLVTRNKLKRRLFCDALMTVPGKREICKTSVLPVDPNLSSFEEWPHPIVQLVLWNFRFSEGGSATQSE